MRIVLVTNAPTPYRNPIYEECHRISDASFHFVFCVARERNRQWSIPSLGAPSTVLAAGSVRNDGLNHSYFTWRILKIIRRLRPDAVITCGFSPVFLLAQIYCAFHRVPHVYMTDGTLDSERGLSAVHRILRKVVFGFSKAFIGASKGSFELFSSYGIKPDQMFRSSLCARPRVVPIRPFDQRETTLLLVGSLDSRKNPEFAVHVAIALKTRGFPVSVAFAGSGPLQENCSVLLIANEIPHRFYGHLEGDELANLYSDARILFLPSKLDAWGVVANEAFQAGTPVICSPHCGVAGDLVVDGFNGYVRNLSVDAWVDASVDLLESPARWREFSENSVVTEARFDPTSAARGIYEAARFAMK